ncbi:MAG: MBL fold metallo-hydrolase [Porticoccaceae bacterium]
MKKTSMAIVAALVFAAIAFSQQQKIVLAAMPTLLDKNMSSDTTAEFEDGLHVALCGAGGPMPSAHRSGACVAVIAGNQFFVVDAGTNGARNLGRMRYPQGEISALLLTHFHSDHIDGLGELAMLRWVSKNNTSPLPVYGPEGVADVVNGFNMAYGQDAVHRNDHHGDAVAPLSGTGMVAHSFAVPANGDAITVFERDGVKIEMFAVDHSPIKPAVAYLFSYKGRTTLISGDTTKSAVLEKFSNGVDLLVHEALSITLVDLMAESAQRSGNDKRQKIFNDILDYHTTPREAAEIARDAKVGHLLYYHRVPPLILPGMESVWLGGAEEIFSEYTVGEDGTTFSMPANSDKIIKRRSGL